MAFMDKLKKILIGEKVEVEPKSSRSQSSDSAWKSANTKDDGLDHSNYKAVIVEKGDRGWGGPLLVWPSKQKPIIYSVTGGGIHPVAQKIADMTGGTAFDGFSSKAEFEEIAVAVVDCGGTARVGVYPMKGVLTVDVHMASPSGPLMKFITEQNFVSGVGLEQIKEKKD